MWLTNHFTEHELDVEYMEKRLIENARAICAEILEPIREHYRLPVNVHCGFRDPKHNKSVGGKPTSWHLFEGGRAAVDIDVAGIELEQLFDWLRLESGLPFDKVILESSPKTHRPACVHIQFDRLEAPRRMAYTGSTGDARDYQEVTVA